MTGIHHVDAAGVEIAYRVGGPNDAPPLVLLHATGETSASWEPVWRQLTGVRRVFAPDLRGHGHSEWPGDYSVELMRDDVLAFLDALELDRVDLVGHSLGGLVAYLLALRAPHRLDHLVLEDVGAPYDREPAPPERPDGDLAFDWDLVPAVRSQIDNPDPAWLEGADWLSVRTLVIGGGPSSPVPQDRVAELADRIPDAVLVTLDTGHMVHDGDPEAFADHVVRFLSDGSPA